MYFYPTEKVEREGSLLVIFSVHLLVLFGGGGGGGGVTEGIFNADCLAVSLLQAIRRRYSDLAPDGES